MSRGVIALRPEELVFTAIALTVEHHVGTIPVVTPAPRAPRSWASSPDGMPPAR